MIGATGSRPASDSTGRTEAARDRKAAGEDKAGGIKRKREQEGEREPASSSANASLVARGPRLPGAQTDKKSRTHPSPQAAAEWEPDPASDAASEAGSGAGSEGTLVEVRVGGTVLASRAVLAEMDEGLVTLPRSSGTDGLYTAGIASCLALIFQSTDMIGLAHTSLTGDPLIAFIEACRQDAAQESQAEVTLTLGYRPDGWIADMRAERARPSADLDDFIEGQELALSAGDSSVRDAVNALPSSATADQRWDCAMRTVQANALRRVELLAPRWSAALLELPHGALLLPPQGPIELFSGPPQDEAI